MVRMMVRCCTGVGRNNRNLRSAEDLKTVDEI